MVYLITIEPFSLDSTEIWPDINIRTCWCQSNCSTWFCKPVKPVSPEQYNSLSYYVTTVIEMLLIKA